MTLPPSDIRLEILGFAAAMERTMRKHDPEKGESWMYCDLEFLINKLKEEFEEVITSIDGEQSPKISKNTIDELVDLANIAMMLRYRGIFSGALA
ncbi:hypothetical protein MSBRW_2509 [Methanosarcina barkeri str. Wiesmoor]|uniref:NTP pyrophosphohydrolase MazG putative catalytic core domain-containing protein n=1 Tax=Methanosarcina barkeri str. Wiesmoor TaxID=1434109 RepID=A0A0E3QNU1_METBA|nr:hypothetical protein [Methanosarcina barkeri]AKB51762.1 hypothetical protein MSBRW_2509 [Methanosarcina barkeri str. Wiesmoor]